jgi:hypothetical protein
VTIICMAVQHGNLHNRRISPFNTRPTLIVNPHHRPSYSLTASLSAMFSRIKDRYKNAKKKLPSIDRSSSRNLRSANISTGTGLQVSSDLTPVHPTGKVSGTTTSMMLATSKQSQLTEPVETTLAAPTQPDNKQLAESTVGISISLKLTKN